MPDAIPLASSGILLGEDSYPDGHTTRGMFELELRESFSVKICRQRLVRTTNTVKFRSFIRFRVVFIDCDGTNILVVSGRGIGELEGGGRRVGHEGEDVGE